MEIQEFADDAVRLEADGVGVGADERATKDAGRPMRDIVAFQRFEQRQLDLRLFRDRNESNLLSFTPLAQSGAETFRHAAHLAGQEGRRRTRRTGMSGTASRPATPAERSPRRLG